MILGRRSSAKFPRASAIDGNNWEAVPPVQQIRGGTSVAIIQAYIYKNLRFFGRVESFLPTKCRKLGVELSRLMGSTGTPNVVRVK